MQTILSLQQEEIDLIYENLMREFTAPDGFLKKDYYGVAGMRYKKNGYWKIRLQYDYDKKRAIQSDQIEFDNLDDYITALVVLEHKAKTVLTKRINLRRQTSAKTQSVKQSDF